MMIGNNDHGAFLLDEDVIFSVWFTIRGREITFGLQSRKVKSCP